MNQSLSIYAEALGSLLQDLPRGAHAMVLTGDAPPEEIVDICRADAHDAGEHLVVHAPFLASPTLSGAARISAFTPRTFKEGLEDGDTAPLPRGANYLLLVFADQAAEATSWADHVGAETTINRLERRRGRVICCYNERALSELRQVPGLRAANAHTVLLPRPEI